MSLKPSYPQFFSFEDINDDDERILKSLLYELQEVFVELPWDVEEEWSNWVFEEEPECDPEVVVIPSHVHLPPPVHQVPPVCPAAQPLIGVPVFVAPEGLSRPPGTALPTTHPAAVRPPFQSIPLSNVPPGIRTVPPPPYGSTMKPQPIDNRDLNCQPNPTSITLEKHGRHKKNHDYYDDGGETLQAGDCVVAYPTEHILLPSSIPQRMPPPGLIPYHAIPQTSVTIAHPYHQYGPAPPFYSYAPQYTAAPQLYAAVYTNAMPTGPYVTYQSPNSHEMPDEEVEEEAITATNQEEEEIVSEGEMYENKDYSDRTEATSVSISENINSNPAFVGMNSEIDKVHNGQISENSANQYESAYDEQCVVNTDQSPIVPQNFTKTDIKTDQIINNSYSAQSERGEDAYINSPPKEEAKIQIDNENQVAPLMSAVQDNVQSPVTPVWGQSKSWSSLFKRETPQCNNNVSMRSSEVAAVNLPHASSYENTEPSEKKCDPPRGFPGSFSSAPVNVTDAKLGEILLQTRLNHRPSPIQPRGLINRGNWCYINATLQALIACPPFYNLLKGLPSVGGLKSGPSTTPVIDSMVEFVHEFKDLAPPTKNRDSGKAVPKRKEDIDIGASFEPQYVYKMLECIKLDSFKGRQEDAEEFLTCLLNSLHEEMVASINMNSKLKNGDVSTNGDVGDHSEDANGDEEEWAVMGPNKKACITRTANIAKSPVSDIFEGQMRSALRRSGETTSCILQSFFSLQLDIQSEKVWTVNDALEGLVSKEAIQGYTCSKTNREVEASKRITLEELPVVLILHLKRFVYDKNGGCQKLNKKVTFPVELELSKELMSPAVKTKYNHPKQRTYTLFAVVYHDGAEAAKGHYVTDVYHNALGTWLRTDDNNINPISENLLTKHHANRVPYLLYYRRCDTIHT